MTPDILEQKKVLYTQKLNDIMSTSVDEEVNKRLAAKRAEVEAQVIAELDADASKCRHYLELIDTLIAETAITEAPVTEEVVENQECINEQQEGVNYDI